MVSWNTQSTCPMCGREGGLISKTPITDEGALRGQLQNMRQWLDELERGQASPLTVADQVEKLCSTCQGTFGERPDRGEVARRLREQIRQLEGRLEVLRRQ